MEKFKERRKRKRLIKAFCIVIHYYLSNPITSVIREDILESLYKNVIRFLAYENE